MTVALWILLGILLFLCVLFLIPLSIKIAYTDTVSVAVGVPGIYYSIFPKKGKKTKPLSKRKYEKLLLKDSERAEKKRLAEEKKAQKKKDSKKAKQAEKEKKADNETTADEPSAISLVLRIVGDILNTFFGKLQVKIARVHIVVGGTDAAKTALTYGVVAQGVAYLMELLATKTKMSRKDDTSVSVVPDFLAQKTTADLLIVFRLRLIDLLSTGIVFLIRFIKEKTASSPKIQK